MIRDALPLTYTDDTVQVELRATTYPYGRSQPGTGLQITLESRHQPTTIAIRLPRETARRLATAILASVPSLPETRWELRRQATGGGPCRCGKPRWTHVCLTCSPDAQTPGPGCHSCRNTGMDQTPCRPATPEEMPR